MKTLPPEISDAERAVSQYKHKLLIKVMACIVRKAMEQPYVSAKDIPEDIVEKEHRQGVASAAWNSLKACEVIQPVPMNLSDERYGIIYGRICNKNPMAHGRMVCAYRLTSRVSALAWLRANGIEIQQSKPEVAFQAELLSIP